VGELEGIIEADEDVRGRVGVVGGFKGARAMDATLEINCESCARSPDTMPWALDVAEAGAG
jgi:hypothetical protein